MKRSPSLIAFAILVGLVVGCASGEKTEIEQKASPAKDSMTTLLPAKQSDGILPTAPADIIFMNARILTMSDSAPAADALAIQGNRITAVGSFDEIKILISDTTQVIDLQGKTLMPGFIDAHQHLFDDAVIAGYEPFENQHIAIENGITSVADMYVNDIVLKQLVAWGKDEMIRLRLHAYLVYDTNCGENLGGWWKNYQPGSVLAKNLTISGVKVFTDGGSCEAPAMSVEYLGGGYGELFLTQEELNAALREIQDAGFQAAIHALGDRSLEQVFNAFQAVLGDQPNTLRHRIEHNATIRPDLLAKYDERGALAIIFGKYPTCIRTAGAPQFKYILDESHGAWDWPYRQLLAANPLLKPAWHSDFLALEMSPIWHMWGMVTRKDIGADGTVCDPPDWLAENRLTIQQVLPMMTINAAYAINRESEIGSLESGKLADLVVLSENPLRVPEDAIKDIRVLMTMIDGVVEFCADETVCPENIKEKQADPSVHPEPTITASASQRDAPAALAFDGNIETVWNSGAEPEQWIQLDFGNDVEVKRIILTAAQYPEGKTVHQIWLGKDSNSLTLVHELSGFTVDKQVLMVNMESPVNARVMRIVTTTSPSWVAWREILVQ